MSAESDSRVVDFPTVLEAELQAIELRRKRSQSASANVEATDKQDHSEIPEQKAKRLGLVGLALSGGGVRSAAVCLGVLQSIHRRGILPLVDYLSTVSGGGYAGSYLTSLSLNPDESSPNSPAHADDIKSRLDAALGTETSPGQPAPIRRLISNGDFLLLKSLTGINRTAIGIMLIAALVGSGLVAAASLAAFLYRSLDAVPCRQFLSVLGISDQLTLDLFPPLVMFLIYLVIWAATYWRSGSATTGLLARWWLAATVVVFLVALATLMGSGNITTDAVAGLIGNGPSTWLQKTLSSLSNLIYPLIVAGLIPFFAPKRLFFSGSQDQPGIQSWIFAVACWALLGGVPFLLVAYFTSEGIGCDRDQFDARLRLSQVKGWERTPMAPLWTSLSEQAVLDNYDSSVSHLWTWVDRGRLESDETSTAGLFAELNRLHGNITKYEMKKDTPVEQIVTGNEWTSRDSRLGVLQRWYHLIEYSLGYAFQVDALDEYQFALIRQQHRDIHDLKERIVFRMNQLLLRPDFYKRFPNELKNPPVGIDATGKLAEEWAVKVRRLRNEAEALEKQYGRQEVPASALAAKGYSIADTPENGGYVDTPWLIELRPRWGLLPENVKDEVSTDRSTLAEQRIREEQSFYPIGEYASGGVKTLQELNRKGETERREDAEKALAHSLAPEARRKLIAAQTDSFFIAKRWHQVADLPELQSFKERLKSESSDSENGDQDRFLQARVEWSVLDSAAWNEVPWGGESPTTVREVDRNLQQILAAQSYKLRRVLRVNRQLLEAYFPGTIESMDANPSSYMVLQRDQAARWGWFCWSLLVFLLVGLLLDLNFTSWHGFYAERIGSTWINPAAGVGPQIPLAQLRNVDVGLPYHLINGSLNPFGRLVRDHSSTELFLLSQLFAGSNYGGYRRTSELEDGNYNLASAVAISGGAVSPLHVKNPLQRVLLLLANVRLGQWIQNPGFSGGRSKLVQWLGRKCVISPFRFMYGWILPLRERIYCFVTDGGLTENLGIKPLLDRRCKLILSIDAGQDGRFQFHDLAKLMRWVQVDDGIRLTFMTLPKELAERADKLKLQPRDLSPVMATGSTESPAQSGADPFGRPLNPDAAQHYLIARIEYPGYDPTMPDNDANTGYLVYIKSAVCANDPAELVNYQKSNPLFPHDPTSSLNFGPDQFESYRHLGEYAFASTVEAILKSAAVQNVDRNAIVDAVRKVFGDTKPAPPPAPVSPAFQQLKNDVLSDSDPWPREFAAKELVDLGEPLQGVIQELVAQLDRGQDVGSVLYVFHEQTIPPLTDGFGALSQDAQLRRVAVLKQLMPKSQDALQKLLDSKPHKKAEEAILLAMGPTQKVQKKRKKKGTAK